MTRPVPTNIVIEMNKRGYKDVDILRYLKQKGYTPVEMSDAFNQAKVKIELSKQGNSTPEESIQTSQIQDSPTPRIMPPSRSTNDSGTVQTLSIKMRALEDRQKQQISYLENLRDQVISKMQENNAHVKELSAQISALQQAFSKILAPLATNVKTKAGMLDLNKRSDDEEENEPEEKIVVVKEKKVETTSKSKSKKDKTGLEDHFGKK